MAAVQSTLADRLLELTGAIAPGGQEQYLDRLQVERERGITVKAQTASLVYRHGGAEYLLNLIDTPGHVDFAYEVSRSLAACQGALLLVDAAQGVQAQTVANWFLAREEDLAVVPVLNKVDLPAADPARAAAELHETFDLSGSPALPPGAEVVQEVAGWRGAGALDHSGPWTRDSRIHAWTWTPWPLRPAAPPLSPPARGGRGGCVSSPQAQRSSRRSRG